MGECENGRIGAARFAREAELASEVSSKQIVARFDDGSVRVGVTGAGSDGVFRHKGMEDALTSDWNAGALDGVSVDEGMMLSDIHGDAAYRANLVKVMAKRAVAAAG